MNMPFLPRNRRPIANGDQVIQYQSGSPMIHFKMNDLASPIANYGSATGVDPAYQGGGGADSYGESSIITGETSIRINPKTNGYRDLAGIGSNAVGTDNFVLAGWLKRQSGDSTDMTLYWEEGGTPRILLTWTSQKLKISFRDSVPNTYEADWAKATSFDVFDDTWGQFALIFNRSLPDVTCEINGQDIGAPATSTGNLSSVGNLWSLGNVYAIWSYNGWCAEIYKEVGVTSYDRYTP